MTNPKQYFFKLDPENRPDNISLREKWYPGVKNFWDGSTNSRIYDSIFGIRAVVIHATAGSSSSGAMSVMKGGNASWHWLVPDENEPEHGKFAWACAPEARNAWHVRNAVSHPDLWEGRNKINHWSLGVEVVNAQSNTDTFSEWQTEMTAEIVRYAWAKYPNLQYVVSHAMLDPHRRTDPGVNFDWPKFEALVKTPPRIGESGLESIGASGPIHMDALEADHRESLCGEAPTTEIHTESVQTESVMGSGRIEPDWKLATLLAEASSESYANETSARRWAKDKLGSTEFEFLDARDTQGFIASSDTATFIVFRGSMGLNDWIANMRINRKPRPYGRVHKGFYLGFKDVEDAVFAAMTRARVAGRDIYFSGHSLGGAIAHIAIAEAHYEIGPTPIAGIYTYGMPKTCNKKAKQYINGLYKERNFRFVNNEDIVTRIPPLSRHVGQLFHFGDDGKLKAERPGFESIEGLESTESIETTEAPDLTHLEFEALQASMEVKTQSEALEGIISIPGAEDHSIKQYIRLIRKHAAGL